MLMRTKAATLTVNPAFLQEIKDSNVELWQTLQEIRGTCNTPHDHDDGAKRLVGLLDQLREHVSLQFSLEESFGYLECPNSVERRLSEYAEIAAAQHFRLFLQLTDLCEMAEELAYRGSVSSEARRLIDDTIAFDKALMQHESCENDLIELAYFDHAKEIRGNQPRR